MPRLGVAMLEAGGVMERHTQLSRLAKVRRSRGVTLSEVGAQVGASKQAVHKLEAHGVRRVETARRYAAALGCHVVDIIQ